MHFLKSEGIESRSHISGKVPFCSCSCSQGQSPF